MTTEQRKRNRRDFLRIGSSALGGLALPMLLPGRGAAASPSVITGKSVIFLFLHGGPSQIETFDPKMGAPAEVRSATGEAATRTASMLAVPHTPHDDVA